MKASIGLLLPILSFAACKAPSYHFVSPTLNTSAYDQAGSGQLGLQFGTVGIGAKGGIALTEHINLNGFVGGLPETKDDYTSRESEFSIGFQTTPRNRAVTGFYAGLGIGHNEKDKITLAGNYNRPFIQIQRALYDRKFFSDKVYADAAFGFRLNYLLYNGVKDGVAFDHKQSYAEPYLSYAIGGRNVRFEIMQGMAIKTSGTWHEGFRIFPYFGNIGLQVKLRKKSSE